MRFNVEHFQHSERVILFGNVLNHLLHFFPAHWALSFVLILDYHHSTLPANAPVKTWLEETAAWLGIADHAVRVLEFSLRKQELDGLTLLQQCWELGEVLVANPYGFGIFVLYLLALVLIPKKLWSILRSD